MHNTRVLQEVKHWIDPRIIPFGWGTFDSGQFEDPQTKDVSCIILPILSADRDKDEDVRSILSVDKQPVAIGQ